jgi:hypothetical protein
VTSKRKPTGPGTGPNSALGAYQGLTPTPGNSGPPIDLQRPSKALNRAARAHNRSR